MTSRGTPGEVGDGAPLWRGRIAVSMAPELLALSRSAHFDVRLWRDDVTATSAHVRMLGRVGVLDSADVESILSALETVTVEFENTKFVILETDEDVHTAIERRVTQLAGSSGARMHTGRSRNDQVSTATRLWCLRHSATTLEMLLDLVSALTAQAEWADSRNPPVPIPAYTHLQRAQVVLLSHHLRAHAWALVRDAERLLDARVRTAVSPLGAGAVGGTSLPLDPTETARALGFSRPFTNSIDAVSDRDFVLEMLFVNTLIGVHLSRLSEEIVLWSGSEFGFVEVHDAFATGSSMLPQKKNPDVAELVRGKTGRLVGDLVSVLVALKGLPLAYNRDMQEDKEPLFDSFDTLDLALPALTGVIKTLVFDEDKLRTVCASDDLYAIDLAEDLVRRGTPFRTAHTIVGELVREALDRSEPLEALVARSEHFGPGYIDFCRVEASLQRRQSAGGGGIGSAEDQGARLDAAISSVRARATMAD